MAAARVTTDTFYAENKQTAIIITASAMKTQQQKIVKQQSLVFLSIQLALFVNILLISNLDGIKKKFWIIFRNYDIDKVMVSKLTAALPK